MDAAFSVSFKGRRSGPNHGTWIREVQPAFGPGIREPFRVDGNNSASGCRQSQGKNESRSQLVWRHYSEKIPSYVSPPHRASPRFGTRLRMSWRRFRAQALSLLCVRRLGPVCLKSTFHWVVLMAARSAYPSLGHAGRIMSLLKIAVGLTPE